MKKFLSGLIAALLMAAGLVAISGHSAQAARGCTNQYVPCQSTKVKASGAKTVNAGKPAKVQVKVSAIGNVKPSGKVTIKVTGPGGFSKTIKVTVKNGKVDANLGKLTKAGKYKVSLNFAGDEGFRDSKSSTTITVKKKKKR